MKNRIKTAVLAVMLAVQTGVSADFEWAAEAVKYCVKMEILSGVGNGDLALGSNITREQMAKIFVEAFSLPDGEYTGFEDVDPGRWSYKYIQAYEPYMKEKDVDFVPDEPVTRQEFASALVLVSGLTEGNIRNPDILSANFDDADRVDPIYKRLMCIAVERGYFKGSDGLLRPEDLLNRAEACALLHRVMAVRDGSLVPELGVKWSQTDMLGEPQVTVEAAKEWAQRSGAEQRFIDVADIYWQYGEITGIRPDILYAQAAKETGFGRFGGAVLPEQNNWAGIKTKEARGDATEDHETFATPEDGVRGHFNHISAYLGLEPVGEPHGRYYSVKSIKWAGTVKYLEELGGKWCPDLYYGYSILHNFIEKM